VDLLKTRKSLEGFIIKLSVIVINDHHISTLQKCVASIINNPPSFEYEVFITDNSGDKQCVDFISKLSKPFVPVPPHGVLEYFTSIQNRLIPKARGKYILFFDADAELLPGGALDKCVSYLDSHQEVGLLTCRLLRSDGKYDPNCRRSLPTRWSSLCRLTKLSELFPKSAIFSQYRMTYLDDKVSGSMDCAYIAFMLVRRDVFNQVGLMDENIYKYGEDIDLSIRALKQGWKIYYFAEAEAMHHNIAIEELKPKMKFEFRKTTYHLFKKHFQVKYGLTGFLIALILKGLLIFKPEGNHGS
jgi:GT2 family glycosyltransferase